MDNSPEYKKLMDLSMRFSGGVDSEKSSIDLYDLSFALRGFHRSIALTTHFVIHGEILTKAPYVRGVRVVAYPPRPGSFTVLAAVTIGATAVYKLGTAPRDTPLGHLVWSLYEYVTYMAIGKRVDPNKTLWGDWIAENEIETSRLESLAQKIEPSIRDMHRPIVTQSAQFSEISGPASGKIYFDSQTLDLTNRLDIDDTALQFRGRIASYSANTRSGMVFTENARRAVPFELERSSDVDSNLITQSLSLYDHNKQHASRMGASGFFKFMAKRAVNSAGMVKKYYITHVYNNSLEK